MQCLWIEERVHLSTPYQNQFWYMYEDSHTRMKVQLILPIAALHGKLNGNAKFYFKTVNGKTYVQRCPDRTAKPATPAQTAARQRFSAIAQEVTRMLEAGTKKSRKQLWKIATEKLKGS